MQYMYMSMYMYMCMYVYMYMYMFIRICTPYLMAAANAADPKTERKTEAERPAVSLGRVGPSRAE